MLSFLTIIRKSLLVVIIALAADGAIEYLLTSCAICVRGDHRRLHASGSCRSFHFGRPGRFLYVDWCCSVQKDSF